MATRSGPVPVPIPTRSVAPYLSEKEKTEHTVDAKLWQMQLKLASRDQYGATKFAFDDGVEVDEGRDISLADGGKEEEDGEDEKCNEAFICDLAVQFDTSRARDGEVRCRAGSMGEAPNVTGATTEAVLREPGNGRRRGSDMGIEIKTGTGMKIKTYLI
ncbi:hypothetical protein ACJ73_09165 [Blastomyces percursus]|uniref:Uncharacterized protein n=1 Tax=Blastomyces percursus TaxID=1658174 RepID=A0A1J9QCC1_9EURO|nr:hypothetical protein ACJ73_09165 [Blastomyces percursus]